jgi:hypothetical protein
MRGEGVKWKSMIERQVDRKKGYEERKLGQQLLVKWRGLKKIMMRQMERRRKVIEKGDGDWREIN